MSFYAPEVEIYKVHDSIAGRYCTFGGLCGYYS